MGQERGDGGGAVRPGRLGQGPGAIARGTLDAFLVVARDKVPRGQRRTLRENNVIQSQVAQCVARLRSALDARVQAWIRRRQGIDIDKVYKEIPVE